jgi:hypothetical protein
MRERQPPFHDESFNSLLQTQRELERLGYFFHPVAKEHTEGGVTDLLLHRLRTQINKRGFGKLAGHTLITFSGYGEDEREIIAIPEIRSFWRSLDQQLPELPALVAYLPQARYNGPGFHVMLLGTIEQTLAHPEIGVYDVRVIDAGPLVDDALRRIVLAGRKYHLMPNRTNQLLTNFAMGATHRIGR